MEPVALSTPRLRLDQPTPADVPRIAEYCRDPLFERYLTTPWPYEIVHAEGFVGEMVPAGWADDSEYTWAIRADGEFVGVIGLRERLGDVGYWMGAPHRGHGYMAEALSAVCDFAFTLGRDLVRWECTIGNAGSAATARAAGFNYTGVTPANVPHRDGTRPPAWHGILLRGDSRDRKPGWPIP